MSIRLVNLHAPRIPARIRLHPGVKEILRHRFPNTKRLSRCLEAFIIQHSTDQEIETYIAPHEIEYSSPVLTENSTQGE